MKRFTLKTAVLVFGLGLFMSSHSFAQQDRQGKKPPTFKELLKEMDKDEDGQLSKDEVKGPLKENFTKDDTDEDGFISEKEFKKAPKPKRREK